MMIVPASWLFSMMIVSCCPSAAEVNIASTILATSMQDHMILTAFVAGATCPRCHVPNVTSDVGAPPGCTAVAVA